MKHFLLTCLPTKNWTSETTVRNVYCPFLVFRDDCTECIPSVPCIQRRLYGMYTVIIFPCNYFFAKLFNKPLKDNF